MGESYMYDLLSFVHILPKGKCKTSICEAEIGLVLTELKRINHNKMIKTNSVSNFIDLVNNFISFSNSVPFVSEIKKEIYTVISEVSILLKTKAHEMTSEELSRASKFLLKLNQEDPICMLFLKNILLSIYPDGTCCLNPIVAIRLITFLRHPFMAQLCPDW
jgi:hypothetical protein